MAESQLNILHQHAQGGDRQAREQLFRLLSARFGIFVRHRVWEPADADDIVQDALLAIGRDYGEMTFQSSFAAWAYKVLDNRILAYIQKKKRQAGTMSLSTANDSDGHTTATTADPGLKVQLLRCLRKISRANVRYARTLNFSYQGFSVEEICRRMALKPNTLYSLLSRARSMLEICLEKGDIR